MLTHPHLEAARTLLNNPPTFPDFDDDEIRMRAGAYALRRLAEEAAETLILMLDELDGDPDLESSLGFYVPADRYLLDAEADDADDEDGGDAEPSLASPELHPSVPMQRLNYWGEPVPGGFTGRDRTGSQIQWARGSRDDREDEHDGSEPDESGYGDLDGMNEGEVGEPSLGWTLDGKAGPDVGDRELDADDEPTLGWTGNLNQSSSKFLGGGDDREDEHDGREPDADGEDNSDAEPDTDAEPDSDVEPRFCGVTVDASHAGPCQGLVPQKNKRRRQGPPRTLIDFDPRNLPEIYAMQADGNCMEPELADGTMLIFDRAQPPQVGNLVGFFFKRDVVLPGEHQGRVKRLVTPLTGMTFPCDLQHGGTLIGECIVFSMNNPASLLAIPCCNLLAVHKCLGPAKPGETHRMTAEQRTALRIRKGMPAI